MRAIITCGGTGGHITPALAIADIIKARDARAELLFVGAKHGMEGEMVSRAGYDVRLLELEGLARRLTFENVRVLWHAVRARREAAEIVKLFDPDIVIGTGGYACYPTLRAAIDAKVPSVVHESNAVPGLTVKLLAPRLTRVWLNFERAREALPRGASTLVVGNPITRACVTPTAISLPEGRKRMLLSFGGSLGADALNSAVLSLMERVAEHPEIYHLHATGKRAYEKVYQEFCQRGLKAHKNLSLVPFITPMPSYMAAADLVISRAGAMTVSELAALGRAAILVPSPNVTGNHQYKNAAALAAREAAVLLREEELEAKLTQTVFSLLENEEKRGRMSRNIRLFYDPQANERIWRDILFLCRCRR